MDQDKEPARPFRLRNAKTQTALRGRAYKHLLHAHNGALIAVRWARDKMVIEVIDTRGMKLLGVYALTPTGVRIEAVTHARDLMKLVHKGADNA